ncbi:GDSL-type esterase/lipase family protein [Nocardia sp. XZ_19_385]|uniref:DUF459 domain-containing protein n=1 Tax=Nocardia sp. XZ_19_385 TaxID=2769488 RepID=UPI00188FDFD8|nr:GDSL-type esterase/lipase family protein [Nocardia sp. XZ_19_385]
MSGDVRVCFVGDSFVAGVGDPLLLGWAGRLGQRAVADGVQLTAYNLGVRRQTSADVLSRFGAECEQRLLAGTDARVVVSFGVNDTTHENGGPRVDPEGSAVNLTKLLEQAAAQAWQVLMVAPPPISDAEQNARTAELDERFAEICASAEVPYIQVHQALLGSEVWMREVRDGDGAHPGAAGYDVLAALVLPHWREWLSR